MDQEAFDHFWNELQARKPIDVRNLHFVFRVAEQKYECLDLGIVSDSLEGLDALTLRWINDNRDLDAVAPYAPRESWEALAATAIAGSHSVRSSSKRFWKKYPLRDSIGRVLWVHVVKV